MACGGTAEVPTSMIALYENSRFLSRHVQINMTRIRDLVESGMLKLDTEVPDADKKKGDAWWIWDRREQWRPSIIIPPSGSWWWKGEAPVCHY